MRRAAVDLEPRAAASAREAPPFRPTSLGDGVLWGTLGMVLFSMSLPATRLAVAGFDPVFITAARAAIAGLLSAAVLAAGRSPRPARRHWRGLLIVAAGVIVGYPLFTTIALQQVPAVHGAIVTGLLPAATAVAGVLLARERPSIGFWLAAAAGLVAVLIFSTLQGTGGISTADVWLLLAVVACAAGYAAGGVLSREMGGLWVIGWALVLCLPLSVPVALFQWNGTAALAAGLPAWAGVLYLAVFSQYFGFVAWYRGLASGGVARVGQLKLAQPVLSMVWAALLLGEAVTASAVAAAAAVLACVVMTQRAR
ncbi:MAG: DMT family transporter [Hyphomicrobiales bacterium]|nr:DMT family transporter [Hyphomicrobiales bacterium]MBV8824262.1 DMT family transporter [Hyphomicrobiales bacterium]MBV9428582.1 DMT family transporter [Bradyrhizobiaceae bacterium]